MTKFSKAGVFTLITFLIAIALPMLGFLFPDTFFSNRDQIADFIRGFGVWGPVIFVLIAIVPVVFTPLNHAIFGIVGGFIFGPWLGMFLNWITKMIGLTINYGIGNGLGHKVIHKVATKEEVAQYNEVFRKHKVILFILLMYNDTFAYLAGMSTMRLRSFVSVIAIAQIIPAIALAYIGNGISLKDPVFLLIATVVIVFGLLYLILQKKLSKN